MGVCVPYVQSTWRLVPDRPVSRSHSPGSTTYRSSPAIASSDCMLLYLCPRDSDDDDDDDGSLVRILSLSRGGAN